MTRNGFQEFLSLANEPMQRNLTQRPDAAHEINRRVRNIERRIKGDSGGSDGGEVGGGGGGGGGGDGDGFFDILFILLNLLGEGDDN